MDNIDIDTVYQAKLLLLGEDASWILKIQNRFQYFIEMKKYEYMSFFTQDFYLQIKFD